MRMLAQDKRPQVAFETKRLRLRELCEDDQELYCDLYCDQETMRYIGSPLSPEDAARSFRAALRLTRRRSPERLFLAIVEKATQRPVGICGVQRFDPRRNRIEAGIMISAGCRARGFAKEGLSALVSQAFALFPVDEVRVEVAADHEVVERLLISVGLSPGCAVLASDVSPIEVNQGKRIWSAHRRSWRDNATT